MGGKPCFTIKKTSVDKGAIVRSVMKRRQTVEPVTILPEVSLVPTLLFQRNLFLFKNVLVKSCLEWQAYIKCSQISRIDIVSN